MSHHKQQFDDYGPEDDLDHDAYGAEAEESINEEEIVGVILQLGNEILKNLNVEEAINDVGFFFSDAFYIQFFQAAFPEIDYFSQMTEGQSEQEMAQNIQVLIQILGEKILNHDLSHIKGEEIVNGNPEHCINLLQLVQEISGMIQNKGDEEGSQALMQMDDDQDEEEEDADQQYSQRLEQEPNQKSANKSNSLMKQKLHQQSSDMEEDDEAQIIHERRKAQNQQQNVSNQKSSQLKQQQRGRSYSDEKSDAKPQQFLDMDEFEISNDFHQQLQGEDDGDDNMAAPHYQQMHGMHDEEDEDEMDNEDYENFLADSNHPQNFNAPINRSHGQNQQQMMNQMDDEDDEGDEDDEEMLQQMQGMRPGAAAIGPDGDPNDAYGEENDDNDEMIDIDDIDFENIDYDQLDPQILQLAEENGVHPKEILKQLLIQQKEGDEYGDEDEQDEDEEAAMIEKQMQEEQLRKEKEAFKAQMGLSSDKKKPAQSEQKSQQKQNHSYSNQKPQQQPPQMYNQQYDYDDENDEDEEHEQEESYYSEGEIKTRIKLLSQKSHSAPYLIINDCYEEPLYDDDDESNIIQRAYSTSMLQSLEALQAQQVQQQQNGYDDDGEDMDEETAQLLYQQQQKMMQQQQQNQNQVKPNKPGQTSKITEVSKSKESSSYAQQQNQMKQMRHNQDDEEDEEMDIDISQKLKDLKQSEQRQQEEYGNEQDEGEGEEDDEEMLIDLDQLDDHNKQMLLEYLQQEYAKNPDQFPYPKELIEEYMMKQQKQNFDQESVKDIKSEEMIVEEANANQESQDQQEDQEDQNDEGELTAEQQQQLQQYLMMQQQQQELQDQEDGQYDEQFNQLNAQFQNHMGFQQQKSKKTRPQSGVRTKKTKTAVQKQQMPIQIQLYQTLEEIPQEILQLSIQLLQEQQIDMENIDPNVLQQLILAQAQQIQQISAQQQMAADKSTIRSTKRGKSSASKKRGTSANTKAKQLARPPHQQMKYLMPSTPGGHIKSFTNMKNGPAKGMSNKKKPLKKKVTGKKPKMMSQVQQHMVQIPQMQNLDEYSQQEQMLLAQQQQQQPQVLDIPNLSEEFLNQLSEEELEQLLQHQQQLMMQQQMQMDHQQIMQMQNQAQSKKSMRPKSGKPKSSKGTKVPQTYSSYSNPYGKSKKGTKGKKKKGTKKALQPQGVVLNNYFPALENGVNAYPGQMEEQANMNPKDARYPKFGTDIINNPQMLGLQQDPIDEVPSEQEEGESQELNQNHNDFYHPDHQEEGQDDDGNEDQEAQIDGQQPPHDQDVLVAYDQDQEEEDQDAQPDDQVDEQQQQQMPQLTDEQLIELIQNAHALSPDQQAQLQLILQQRMQLDNNVMAQERAQSYQNIYQILMENVRRAQERLAPLGQVSTNRFNIEDADMRILKQKEEFETLLRLYHNDLKNRQQKKYMEDAKLEKKLQRESKIQAIKEKKFQEELALQQKSLNYKRNAQQVKLCQKVYKLASELEKNKLLAEKKEYKENLERKKVQNKLMVDAIETYYKNQISMLREKIENERFERKIAQQAQHQALARMKRELRDKKKKEVDKYLHMLKQEDQRYDFESINANKLEQELVKMYRHGAVR